MITVKKISYILVTLCTLFSCAVKEDEQQVDNISVKIQVLDDDIDGDFLAGATDSKPNRASVPDIKIEIEELTKISFDYIESDKFIEFNGKQNSNYDLNPQDASSFYITKQFISSKSFALSPDSDFYTEGIVVDLFSNDLLVTNRENLYLSASSPEFRDLSGKFSFKLKIAANSIEKDEEVKDFILKLYFLDKNNIKEHVKTIKITEFSGATLSENSNELIVTIDLDEIPPRQILKTISDVGSKVLIEIDEYTLIRNKEKIKYSDLISNIRNKCVEIVIKSDESTERIFLSDYDETFGLTLKKISEDTKFTNSQLSSFSGKSSNLHILNDWRQLPDGLGSWVIASSRPNSRESTKVNTGDTFILNYINSRNLKNNSEIEKMIYMSNFSGRYDLWRDANVKELKEVTIYTIPISETGYIMQNHSQTSTFGTGGQHHSISGQFLFKYTVSDRNELESNIKDQIKIIINDENADTSLIDFAINDQIKSYKTSLSFDDFLRPSKLTFSNEYTAKSNWRGFRYFFSQDSFQLSSDHGWKNALRSPDTEDYKDQKINLYIFYKY